MFFRFAIASYQPRRDAGEAGFFLIEMLVAIVLFAILGLAFAQSIIFGTDVRVRAIHRSAAMQIASDMMEGEATVDPLTLSEASSFSDTVDWQGDNKMLFRRNINFYVNSDGSRTVIVRVTDLSTRFGGTVEISNTFAPWGSY